MTSLGISYPPRQPRPSARPVLTLAGIPLRGRIHRGVAKPWAHALGCDCAIEETFTCRRCGRRFGWCLGDYDIMPTACRFCCGPGEAR